MIQSVRIDSRLMLKKKEIYVLIQIIRI